jgi:hypothetical protein
MVAHVTHSGGLLSTNFDERMAESRPEWTGTGGLSRWTPAITNASQLKLVTPDPAWAPVASKPLDRGRAATRAVDEMNPQPSGAGSRENLPANPAAPLCSSRPIHIDLSASSSWHASNPPGATLERISYPVYA